MAAAAGSALQASLQASGKLVHRSAVCLIPPRELWAPIQEIRCFRDKSFTRWPPHVNLLYPFLEDNICPSRSSAMDTFAQAAQRCAEALERVQPFEVCLEQLRFFEHGPGSCTLWLDPVAPELLELQAALEAAFPQCTHLSDDPGRGISCFTPHLSLGQARGRQAAAAAAQELGQGWRPLRWRASSVALISRQGFEDPFSIRWVVPLGGTQPPRQVDLPYAATVGPATSSLFSTSVVAPPSEAAWTSQDAGAAGRAGSSSTENGIESSAQHPAEELDSPLFTRLPAAAGAGTAAGPASPSAAAQAHAALGVWNFAYGANMSPAKLGGSRGLHPRRSLPARLPGWRLCFTHRGAMGNIVPCSDDASSSSSASAGAGAAGREGTDATGQAVAGTAAAAASSPTAVHGLLHLLSPKDYAQLANMEHEYRPVEVEVEPYGRSQAGTSGTIRAVAFVTPDQRCILEGLPPSERYLALLREGAAHWGLDASYQAWLAGLPSVAGNQRGDQYYCTPDGSALEALPKIRTGKQQQRGRGRGGGGRGGRGQQQGRQGRRQQQEGGRGS